MRKKAPPPTTLGLVNDNPVACEAVRRVLREHAKYDLLWTAFDGKEALERCKMNPPDVVLMDIVMPRMDGVEATRRITAATSCAVLLVTGSIPQNTAKIFEAMGAGALDVVTTPSEGNRDEADVFFRKIDQIQSLKQPTPPISSLYRSASVPSSASESQKLILLGASAGGPAALASILRELPPTLPAGIVIIQHMDVRFGDDFIKWLAEQTLLKVMKASPGDAIEPGLVLVGGAEHHLIFQPNQRLQQTSQPALSYIPSVDVLFGSAADHWKGSLAAAVLTGMGSDGARGLKSLRDEGHLTLAQDESSSVLYGMPKAAAAAGGAREILPLTHIANRLISFSSTGR